MLVKPQSCLGCPLAEIGTGFMQPTLAGFNAYGVALLGEALGADEAEKGQPFVGKAGFRLSRLIEWAGLDKARFDIYNTVWCRPPDNKLEGMPFERGAIDHCKTAHWGRLVQHTRVLVPLGNVPTGALLGKKGILSLRGYVYPGEGYYVLPTVHPSFIQRGQAKWSAPFINDLQKAVELATNGMPPQLVDYALDPAPITALGWARQLLESRPRYIAFDIETPGKGEDEDELDSEGLDKTWNIERIGFSGEGLKALSIPWSPEYFAVIRLLLDNDFPKVVWNAGFDVPRIRRAGFSINGTIHDGMVAWHILHSDLPKRLAFVSTFTCPWQPAWKHLSGAKPAFYNATDADVEYRAMVAIEEELKRTGLWEVYQRDVVDLDPLLVHMHEKGMPVDESLRLQRARELAEELERTKCSMADAVPNEARRIEHVYRNTPKDTTGLWQRPGRREVPVCSICGAERPTKQHFRQLKKRSNPCANGQVDLVEREVTEFYRLAEFTPSRDQLIRYHQFLDRPLPTIFDRKQMKRKISFGERQLKDLLAQYPEDVLYSLILKFREVDKIASTYIGRPLAV